MAADSMRVARVSIGCDSLSAGKRRIKSQEPSLQGIFYIHPRSPLIGGKEVFNIAVCYSAKGGQDSQRKSCVRLRYSRQARAPTHRHRDFRRVIGAQGLRCLSAYNHAAPTHSTSLPGRPDSHAPASLPLYCYSWLGASGGVTFLPRSNLIPSAAGRAVPAWLLCHLCQAAASAEAEATSCPKQHRPILLTRAPASCRISPTSHARPGVDR